MNQQNQINCSTYIAILHSRIRNSLSQMPKLMKLLFVMRHDSVLNKKARQKLVKSTTGLRRNLTSMLSSIVSRKPKRRSESASVQSDALSASEVSSGSTICAISMRTQCLQSWSKGQTVYSFMSRTMSIDAKSMYSMACMTSGSSRLAAYSTLSTLLKLEQATTVTLRLLG